MLSRKVGLIGIKCLIDKLNVGSLPYGITDLSGGYSSMYNRFFKKWSESLKIGFILFLVVSCTISLCACGTEDSTDITSGLVYDENDNTWSSEDEKLKPLANIMKRECGKSSDIKGSYILGTDDNIIFIGGINATDVNGNIVDAFTTYEIGSLTKMFTATAVLQLCEDGKISLDDTLNKYFPEFKYGKDITIDQLLHMRSGLRRDYITEETFLSENGERNIEEWKRYYYDGFTDEELLDMVFDDELMFEPGTEFSYSNVGYNLLAMIIEKVTDRPYSDYLQENIFDVCGMTHTSSMKTGDVTSVPEFVPSKDAPDEDPYEYVDTLYMQLIKPERGVGDIHSCAYDMLLFDRALISGKLINEKSLTEMFDTDGSYGCGWMQYGELQHHPVDGIYFHGGETWVYKGYNMYCNTEKYGNVYLIQLHPTTAGDEYSVECMQNIVMSLK